MTTQSAHGELVYSSLGGDPDLGELVALFADEIPQRTAAVRDRLAAHDSDGLRRLAHQLKGAAGSYGFAEVSIRAAALETALCNGEPEAQVLAAVDTLLDVCRRVRPGVPQN